MSDPELLPLIKKTIVDSAWLKMDPAVIADDCPLYGEGGLSLESIDLTTLVFDLEKIFAIRLPEDLGEAAKIIHTPLSIQAEILRQREQRGEK
jgi:acyl carrier protein